MNTNLANKEDVLNCLRARMTGIQIQEANQYISKIEVIKYILLIVILDEFYEYKNIWGIIF
jgi:hypothetical protein